MKKVNFLASDVIYQQFPRDKTTLLFNKILQLNFEFKYHIDIINGNSME
jgi:hypothetical protein